MNFQAPKLNSVVGILGHLAGSHFAEIRSALLELFQVCKHFDIAFCGVHKDCKISIS
jgi:hypothetical protein